MERAEIFAAEDVSLRKRCRYDRELLSVGD